jgi:hypothetical protein
MTPPKIKKPIEISQISHVPNQAHSRNRHYSESQFPSSLKCLDTDCPIPRSVKALAGPAVAINNVNNGLDGNGRAFVGFVNT